MELPLWLYALFALFVVVAMSNAVNLTDGLDGLAIGPVMINAGAYMVWAYIAGAVLFGKPLANYLDIAGIPEMSELAIFGAAVIGAGIGFLWYNTYPAQVFMGDVGSLSLGGGLGMMAVLTKNELLSVLLGRRIRARGRQRRDAGRELQAVRQARVPDGADSPPLREEGLAGAAHHRPLLDRVDPVGPGFPVVPEGALMDLAGKRVVVVGLGKSGVAAARLCRARGARVVGTRSGGAVQAVRGGAGPGHSKSLPAATPAWTFRAQDLIVVSPGVPAMPELDARRGSGRGSDR